MNNQRLFLFTIPAIVVFIIHSTIGYGSMLGDCNDDGSVTISEIQTAVNQHMGIDEATPCNDEDGDNTVDILELQKIIDNYSIIGGGPTGDVYTNNLDMTFNLIPAGTFIMGSPADERGRLKNETQHQVTITHDFYLMTTEVTRKQWEAVMGPNSTNPWACDDNCPIEGISWFDIQLFITKMNALGEGVYRLPTEAEWEYAAKSGTEAAFANKVINAAGCKIDPYLDHLGWYCSNAANTIHPVAQKASNAWGLYDMQGNVGEWCADWYGDYAPSVQSDPTGPSSGIYRVVRGGGYDSDAESCRGSYRTYFTPDETITEYGFRLVVAAPNHHPTPLLEWDRIEQAKGYMLYFIDTDTGQIFSKDVGNVTEYALYGDLNIQPGIPYQFQVTCYNDVTESAPSNAVTWMRAIY